MIDISGKTATMDESESLQALERVMCNPRSLASGVISKSMPVMFIVKPISIRLAVGAFETNPAQAPGPRTMPSEPGSPVQSQI